MTPNYLAVADDLNRLANSLPGTLRLREPAAANNLAELTPPLAPNECALYDDGANTRLALQLGTHPRRRFTLAGTLENA